MHSDIVPGWHYAPGFPLSGVPGRRDVTIASTENRKQFPTLFQFTPLPIGFGKMTSELPIRRRLWVEQQGNMIRHQAALPSRNDRCQRVGAHQLMQNRSALLFEMIGNVHLVLEGAESFAHCTELFFDERASSRVCRIDDQGARVAAGVTTRLL